MTYGTFAYIYDELMKEAPYDEWVRFTEEVLYQYHVHPETIIDLGCGTGEITLKLAEKGYALTGIDLSEDMLTVAEQKSYEKKLPIRWVQQDIRDLKTPIKYDLAVSYCDVINYLTDKEQVLKAFREINHSLHTDGFFLFDVHSEKYVRNFLSGQTFAEVQDQISYIWFCHPGEHPGSVEHDLTFFVKETGSNSYQRYHEYHVQRTFPQDLYENWLKLSGFDVLDIYGDFMLESPDHNSDRIFFICRKKQDMPE